MPAVVESWEESSQCHTQTLIYEWGTDKACKATTAGSPRANTERERENASRSKTGHVCLRVLGTIGKAEYSRVFSRPECGVNKTVRGQGRTRTAFMCAARADPCQHLSSGYQASVRARSSRPCHPATRDVMETEINHGTAEANPFQEIKIKIKRRD